jgi:hypothetical protein
LFAIPVGEYQKQPDERRIKKPAGRAAHDEAALRAPDAGRIKAPSVTGHAGREDGEHVPLETPRPTSYKVNVQIDVLKAASPKEKTTFAARARLSGAVPRPAGISLRRHSAPAGGPPDQC